MADLSPNLETRWLAIRNDSGEKIPAFGLVELTEVVTINRRKFQTVIKPSADSLPGLMLNSLFEIPIGGFGTATRDFPNFVKYNTAATPVNGESWGSKADSFLLTKDQKGFFIYGGANGSVVEVTEEDSCCERWITKNTDYTAIPNDAIKVYPPNPGDPYPTITLPPSPTNGDRVRIYDGGGESGTTPIPVNGNGELIYWTDSDFSQNVNYSDVTYVFRSGVQGFVDGWAVETGATGHGLDWTLVPFAHYKLGDNGASPTVDDSAGSNNGTASVNTDVLSASPGLILGGTSMLLVIASSHKIDIDGVISGIISDTAGSFSVMAKPTVAATGDTQELIAFADTDGQSGIYLRIEADGKAGFIAEENDNTKWNLVTDSVVMTDGVKKHIFATHDGVEAKIYIDGKVVPQTFITDVDRTWFFGDFSAGNIPDNGRIGSRSDFGIGDFGFLGAEIQDVRIYRTGLVAQDVAAIVNRGAWTLDTSGTL